MLMYTVVDSPLGWIGLARSTLGLRRVVPPQPSPNEVLQALGITPAELDATEAGFGDLPYRLRHYLTGHAVTFADKLDYTGASEFQRTVWQVVRRIPYGETRSYAWVAEQVGMPGSARAVGQAMARNPLPLVIPCHRVIASNGTLGGYNGRLELKRQLLEMERQGNHRQR